MTSESSNSTVQRSLWIAAAISAALAIVLAVMDRAAFFPAYLIAYIYWFGISLGALLIGLVHGLTGGRWGEPIAAPVSAAARTMPLLAILFLPVAMNLDVIYSWAGFVPPKIAKTDEKSTKTLAEKSSAHPAGSQAAAKESGQEPTHAEVVGINQRYLNPDAFRIRAAIYFVLWSFFAWAATRRPLRAVVDPTEPRRRLPIAGWGLAICSVLGTFAALDWTMSLAAPWYSTIYGVVAVIGQCLLSMAFLILMAMARPSLAATGLNLSRDRLHDLGNLLLALVMLWAYMSFSQFLIIWSGNVPEEDVWYLPRVHHGWAWVPGFLMLFHFAVPFACLLSRDIKRSTKSMARLTFGLLLVRWIDAIWIVLPAFRPQGFWISFVQLVTMAAVGTIWMIGFNLQYPIGPLRSAPTDRPAAG